MTKSQQKEIIEWAIQKLQDYENEKKIYNLSAIILSTLDVICGILALIYVELMTTSIVASILCGTVWGARFIQIIKAERLANALKLLKVMAVPSLTYLAIRKRRGEIMTNIKIKNWIIAGLNVLAIGLGVTLVFVEPNVITNNIEAVITGAGALLGVNVAIPCFNNAKVTKEEQEQIEATKQLKLAKKQAKAQLKSEQKAQIEAKTAEILANANVEAINVENQVINAEKVEIHNAEVQNAEINQQ